MSISRCISAALLVVCLFITVTTTPAETSIYGAATVADFGLNGGGYGNESPKGHTGGITAGAFYTFRSSSRLKAGIDGRVTYTPGSNGGSAYTGALRVSFVPNRNRLRPYLQVGGGIASTQGSEIVCYGDLCGTTAPKSISNGVAQFLFGLDIRATSHVDIRALEYGAEAGAGGNTPHAGLGFIDAGVVYHF